MSFIYEIYFIFLQFYMADFPVKYPDGWWFIFLVTLCISSVHASHSRKCCCINKPIMSFISWHFSGQQDSVLLFSRILFTTVTCTALLMKVWEITLPESSATGLLKAALLSHALREHCKRNMPVQKLWINLACQADKDKSGRRIE